ncbi:MAG TPA: histidinol dehydrogenase [Saprospiraceae bacterium]|nr:histidinol dehydrogenase [Saprospiraceae bacterium]
MKIYTNPPAAQWDELLKRPTMEVKELDGIVKGVLDDVRAHGDEAVAKYTKKFDKADLKTFQVSKAEVEAAEAALDEELKDAILLAKENIESFHRQQRTSVSIVETMPGVKCWRRSVGIEKVGLYVPGGTAPLFSSVLMLGIPAVIGGCREIVLCSPPNEKGELHPAIIYAADQVGVSKIFKIGGIQAIAAMAYGTESVPQVYKIFGPGNQYVTAAKQMVSREGIAIDMPAGPSEVLVCADETADPTFVAADLLSQAEHGVDSQVVLVAFDQDFVQRVQGAIEVQLASLPRQEIARKALDNSVAIVMEKTSEALDLINAYAPEHLILSVKDVESIAEAIINAGSVFLGNFTPESAGDYASGTNHTLPTNGFARAYSGVSVDSFVKKITFQQISESGLQKLGPAVEAMAAAEQLQAHKEAVSIRLARLSNA